MLFRSLGHVYLEPSGLRIMLFGMALVLVMLYRPAGLWPSTTRKRELAGERASG